MWYFITLLFLLLIWPQVSLADTLSGSDYSIQTNITIIPTKIGTKPSPAPTAIVHVQPLTRYAPVSYATLNMSLSENTIDFAHIEATTPLKRTTTIAASSTT